MRMAISNVVMMKLMLMMKVMLMKVMLMKLMLMPILIRSALVELKNKFNRSAASSDITINRKVSLLFISPLIRSMLLKQISPLRVVFMFSFSSAGELQVSQMRERVQVHDPVERPHSFQARMLAPSTTTGFPRTENKDNLLWESSQLKSYLLMMC